MVNYYESVVITYSLFSRIYPYHHLLVNFFIKS